MKISVTKADIGEGKKCSPWKCPVALALKRNGFPKAVVGSRWIRGVIKDGISISPEVKSFITKFDRTGKGKPFTFAIPDK